VNWDAIGALAELAGAIGVILTLFYVAHEIRESNKSSRRAAVQEVLNLNRDVMMQITSSVQASDLWIRAISDQELTPEETNHYHIILYSNVLLWERMYFLHEEGLLDEWIWDDLSRQIADRVRSRRFQRWFRAMKSTFYNDKWRVYLEQRIEEANEESPRSDSSELAAPVSQQDNPIVRMR